MRTIALLAGLLPVLASAAQAAPLTSVSITPWRGDARGAHTIAHDDYCSPGVSGIEKNALPILEARGLKAAVGVIGKECKPADWARLKELIAKGYEPFNHTLSHSGELEAGTLAAVKGWDAKREILDAHALMLEKTGYRFSFIGYPFDLASPETRAMVKQQPDYLGARAAKHLYDGSMAGLNTDEGDPYFVKWDVYWTDGKWSLYKPGAAGSILIQHAEAAINSGSWTFRTMHGVADGSWEAVPLAEYTAYADYLKQQADAGKLWIATPTEVIRYRETRRYCSVKLDSKGIQFDTSATDCKRYAIPVTLAITAASAPVLQQGSKKLAVKAAGDKRWLVEADPLAGPVLVQ
ncbi:polysaccharide deacetylase family protein [Chitinilyticum piscinae]|uniref:Polysaccharide deacetylase family protein n=1 Tax=Chitinilyticum piscinae TaxID=2866724 RepID=A0A8J7K7M1_9NEIS|nr:polysaccharide deacetylase family protein [Chitinilyticum piscinae]MBE9608278.1 polysaccharide deacetylase family protein [Chitinilyticum piscinae]